MPLARQSPYPNPIFRGATAVLWAGTNAYRINEVLRNENYKAIATDQAQNYDTTIKAYVHHTGGGNQTLFRSNEGWKAGAQELTVIWVQKWTSMAGNSASLGFGKSVGANVSFGFQQQTTTNNYAFTLYNGAQKNSSIIAASASWQAYVGRFASSTTYSFALFNPQTGVKGTAVTGTAFAGPILYDNTDVQINSFQSNDTWYAMVIPRNLSDAEVSGLLREINQARTVAFGPVITHPVMYYPFLPKTTAVVNTTDVNSGEFGFEGTSVAITIVDTPTTAEFGFEATSVSISPNFIVNSGEFGFEGTSAAVRIVDTPTTAEFGFEATSVSISPNFIVNSGEYGFESTSAQALDNALPVSAEFGFESTSTSISSNIVVNSSEYGFEATSTAVSPVVLITPAEFGFEASTVSLTIVELPDSSEYGFESTSASVVENISIDDVRSAEYGFESTSASVFPVLPVTPAEFGFEATSVSISPNLIVNSGEYGFEVQSATATDVVLPLSSKYGFEGTSVALRIVEQPDSSEYGFEATSVSVSPNLIVNSGEFGFEAQSAAATDVILPISSKYGFEGTSVALRMVEFPSSSEYGFESTSVPVSLIRAPSIDSSEYGFKSTSVVLRIVEFPSSSEYGFTGGSPALVQGYSSIVQSVEYGFKVQDARLFVPQDIGSPDSSHYGFQITSTSLDVFRSGFTPVRRQLQILASVDWPLQIKLYPSYNNFIGAPIDRVVYVQPIARIIDVIGTQVSTPDVTSIPSTGVTMVIAVSRSLYGFKIGTAPIASIRDFFLNNPEFGFKAKSVSVFRIPNLTVTAAKFGFKSAGAKLGAFTIPVVSDEFGYKVRSTTLTQLNRVIAVPAEFGFKTFGVLSLSTKTDFTVQSAEFGFKSPGVKLGAFNLGVQSGEFGFKAQETLLVQRYHFTITPAEFGFEAKQTPLTQTQTIGVQSGEFGFETVGTVQQVNLKVIAGKFGFEATQTPMTQRNTIGVQGAEYGFEQVSAVLHSNSSFNPTKNAMGWKSPGALNISQSGTGTGSNANLLVTTLLTRWSTNNTTVTQDAVNTADQRHRFDVATASAAEGHTFLNSASQTLTVGQQYTMSGEVTGTMPFDLYWYDGNTFPGGATQNTHVVPTGGTNVAFSFTFTPTTQNLAGFPSFGITYNYPTGTTTGTNIYDKMKLELGGSRTAYRDPTLVGLAWTKSFAQGGNVVVARTEFQSAGDEVTSVTFSSNITDYNFAFNAAAQTITVTPKVSTFTGTDSGTMQLHDAFGQVSATVNVSITATATVTSGKILAHWEFNYTNPPSLATLQSEAPLYNHTSMWIAVGDGGNGGGLRFDTSLLASDVKAWTDSGRTIVLGIGGSAPNGISITTAQNVTDFVNSVISICDTYGFQGVDYDFENDEFDPAHLATASQNLINHYAGLATPKNFLITMSPQPFKVRSSSTTFGTFATSLGVSKIFAASPQWYQLPAGTTNQQYIDQITADINSMIGYGFTASQILIGCSDGPDASPSPPLATYVTAWNNNVQAHPTLLGTKVWHAQGDRNSGYAFGGTASTSMATAMGLTAVSTGLNFMLGYKNITNAQASTVQGWLGRPLDAGSATVDTSVFMDAWPGNNANGHPYLGVGVAWHMLNNSNFNDMSQAAAGNYNATLYTTMVNACLNWGGPIVSISPGWEFNGSWYPWATGNGAVNQTAANYIAAYKQIAILIRTAFKNANKPIPLLDWCYNFANGNNQFSNGNPPDRFPGAYNATTNPGGVDVVSCDFYEANLTQTGSAGWTEALGNGGGGTATYGVTWGLNFAVSNGIKFGLREFAAGTSTSPGLYGSGTGSANDGQWVTAMTTWANNNAANIRYLNWSNDPPADNIVNGNTNEQNAYITAWKTHKFNGTWWTGPSPAGAF